MSGWFAEVLIERQSGPARYERVEGYPDGVKATGSFSSALSVARAWSNVVGAHVRVVHLCDEGMPDYGPAFLARE